MNYPLISEYVEAIKAAEDNFEQLKHLSPVLGEDGEPVMTSGNFAVVFKMKDEQTGKLHAVKCFLKEQEGRAEAYRQIAEELEYVSSTFLTPIKYLDKELFVDSANSEDSEFPVLLMDWVEGQTLDKYIREHIDDHYELSLLAYQFSRLAMWLMPQPFAHGDLKPDNILVKEDGTLVLVDYDGMYVPAMKGQKARELGSPDFRHPGRTEEVFDDHIDDFSLASILLSLKAIALQPSLLEEYGASDRLLFSEKDYRNLSESNALGALQPLMQDAELASLYSLYILALSQNNLSQVSFRLFNLSRPDKSQYEEENLSTEVTEEDLANAWTDEYGVKYSADKKRLLKAPRLLHRYSIRQGTKVICDQAFIYSFTYDDSSIIIPDGVEIIGKQSFKSCTGLDNVALPSSVKTIGFYAFESCQYLKSINLSYGLKRIDESAFNDCIRLENIIIPNSVVSIGSRAFCGCRSLSTFMIPESVNTIGVCLFYGCKTLKCIQVDNRNPIFDSRDGCNAIIETANDSLIAICPTTIIPKNIRKICACGFAGLDVFSTIRIPDSVVEIGNSAFEDCRELISIVIPNSVNYIGDSAFKGCEMLSSVTMSTSVVIIGNEAFHSCSKLSQIELPNSLKKIGDYAFSYSGLATLFLPKNVEKVGNNPFADCFKLIEINVNKSNIFFDSRDNCNSIIETSSDRLISGCIKSIIPYGIKTIGESAFCGVKIETINIPNTVKEIRIFAFDSCDLTSITIPDSVTDIGCSFSGCKKLKTVSIPSNLNSINGCEYFEGIDADGFSYSDIMKLCFSPFDECDHLVNIIIPEGTKSKFEKMFPYDKDKLVEQDEEEEICLAYCSEDSQACEDKEYALWQPHSKILKKNGKLGVVIDDGTTKKQIIPFIYDTWFDYDGYEIDIRENFFDNYQDYIGYFAIKNSDGTFTIHDYDKDGTLTTSFTCEKFNPDSYSLHGKYILRYPKDEVEYDDIRRMRMYCDTYLDTSYLAFRKGNKWSLKSDDLKTTYIDFLDCDGFGSMYWTPKGYYVEIKNGEMSQICLCRKNSNLMILPDKYDYVSLRYFGTSQNNIDSVCFEIRKGDKLAVCSNDLQNISPFIFDSVGSMINNNEVKVTRLINGNKYEFIYQIVNSNGWIYNGTRPFSPEEIAAVARAEVVPSQFGNSVCFFMNGGGQTYIPLLNYSSLTIGDSVDLKTAKLVTLCREGDDDIYRVIEK